MKKASVILIISLVFAFSLVVLLPKLLRKAGESTLQKESDSAQGLNQLTPTTAVATNAGGPPVEWRSNEAKKVIVQMMAGHAPEQLPDGVSKEDVQKAWLAMLARGAIKPVELDFYGKVVDQDNAPLAGAQTKIEWDEAPKYETKIIATNTGPSGSFSMSGGYGSQVRVLVDVPGYLPYAQNLQWRHVDYSSSQGRIFTPDPLMPAVFKFHRKGQGVDLVTSDYGVQRAVSLKEPADGTAVWLDFLSRHVGSAGHLEVRRVRTPYLEGKKATEWSFTMEIPDGGLIEHSEEFPFLTPDRGYQTKIELSFKRNLPGWKVNLRKQYYVTFGNPKRFGRIEVETGIMNGTRIYYVINPFGTRVLESK